MTVVAVLEPSEYPLWDEFVDSSPQGDIFCYSWWLRTVTNDDFKVLVIQEQGSIVAGIILPFYSTNRINEPYLTRTLGVLYREQQGLALYRRRAKERRWLNLLLEQVPLQNVVQMCMSHNFFDWLPFRWKGFKQTTRYTYLLDYRAQNTSQIWTNLRKSNRNTIGRAIKNEIAIRETDDVELAYRFFCLSFERQGRTFPYSLDAVKALDEEAKKRDRRKIFLAVDRARRPHAVEYSVFTGRSAYRLLSGGDPELRSLGGHTLILWHVIHYFSDQVDFFNFGGSDIQPIEQHVRGFGGVQTGYHHIYNEKLLAQPSGLLDHAKQIKHHSEQILECLSRKSCAEILLLPAKMLRHFRNRKQAS